MIQVKGLTKVFPSGTKAIDNLDMVVEKGEIFGLLGPNGAGKTTTIRILSTISGFDSGSVRVVGHDVDREPHKVRESIGVVAQQTGVDYFMTGRENLVLQGHLYKMKRPDIDARIEELSKYFDLGTHLDNLVSTYSGGMRRKLDIATALIHRPQLLFLDEPTLGLDIKSRKSLWRYILELNDSFGLTILLTTHYLEEADQLVHRVGIINAGKIRITGTPEELKQSICGDAVVLELDPNQGALQKAAGLLKEQPYVEEVLTTGNKLHVYVENGAECVPKITTVMAGHDITVVTLSLARPTLDDVFLKYTGTSMTGGEEESGDEWWKQWAGKGGGGKWQKQWQQAQDETEAAEENAAEDQQSWQKWQKDSGASDQGDWQKWQQQDQAGQGQDTEGDSSGGQKKEPAQQSGPAASGEWQQPAGDDKPSGSDQKWPQDATSSENWQDNARKWQNKKDQ